MATMASQVSLNGLGPVSVHVLHGTGQQPTMAYVPAQRFVVTPQPFIGVRTSQCTQSMDPGRAVYGAAVPAGPAGLPSGKAPAVAMQVRYLQSPLPSAPKEAAQVPSAGSFLSKGLCRQSTGENLATYFDHGRRRKTAAPKVVEEAPRSPKRLQPQQPTSILQDQDLNSGPDLQAASPRGKPQAWSQAVKRVKHFTDRSEQLRHGPKPTELPMEVAPRRRMVHTADNPPSERQTLPQRSSSNDAAHRRSTGVWTCLESTSDGEANDRIGRRRWLPHYSSSGAARGMQLQAEKPEALQENPSGEETADGFPSGRKHSQKRHLQNPETGTLVDGLSTRSPEEWQQVALGGKRRGRTSEGAKEYCRRSPGPWEQLPEGTVKKDAWGRLSPRAPPTHSPRVPFGTEENKIAPPAPVRRFHSAPPLPYGSDVDVPEPSEAPRSGFPLGLDTTLKPSSLFGRDGGSAVPQIPEDETCAAGSGEPRRVQNFRERPSAVSLSQAVTKAKPRSTSADSGRPGRSLLSSNFVDRQRATRQLRGGSARLHSGGNLAHSSLLRPQSEHENNRTARLTAGLKAQNPEVPPSPQLEEAYRKCLESLRNEIEELQSRSTHLEKEVQKTAIENGMLKFRRVAQDTSAVP